MSLGHKMALDRASWQEALLIQISSLKEKVTEVLTVTGGPVLERRLHLQQELAGAEPCLPHTCDVSNTEHTLDWARFKCWRKSTALSSA